MSALTIPQLLTITPIDEVVKKTALEKLPIMTPDEKFKLEQICWTTIRNVCEVKKRNRLEEEIDKTAKEGRVEKIDMAAIEDQVLNELLQKIVNIQTEDQIEEVKRMLKENLASQPQLQTPTQK